MTLEELINKENLKREVNNPRVIFVNFKYQGTGCKVFNIYYANLLPIDKDKLLIDLRRYGNYEKKLSLKSTFDEEEFESFIDRELYPSIFGGCADTNRHKRYLILDRDIETIVFSHECSEMQKENFDELVKIYNHIPTIPSCVCLDEKNTYTFKSEEERDIFGHALLDGLSEIEAYAMTQGIEINAEKIPYIGGYYNLKTEYREYYKRIFGVR